MKKHLIYLLSSSLLLCAAETPPENGSLSSTNASYDGNALVLSGHVELDHGLGKMTAEEASLQRQETNKDFPFSLIQLKQDVVLALKNNAQILCGSADLDFTSLKGTLLPSEGSTVTYKDYLKANGTPLTLTSRMLDLNFSKMTVEGKKTEYEVDTVVAKQDVVIDYAVQFQLLADHALYRREMNTKDKKGAHEFQGIISAYPHDETSHCRLIHGKDIIDADMIDLNLIDSRITLLHPKGKLATAILLSGNEEDTHFQAEYLFWDHVKNSLILKNNVRIDEATLGSLTAEKELTIKHLTENGKTAVQSIRTEGPSSLIYHDDQKHAHKLLSKGYIHIDRSKLQAVVESPHHKGAVALDDQLYYEEEELAVFADHAQVEWVADNSAETPLMQPNSLTLKGNIRLYSHDPKKPARYGLADRLTYSLATRTLILSADPGKKVLFTDESQGMHLSAPEVHITYDPEKKEQNIKGVGKVQMSFTPEEQAKIQQFFPKIKS